MVCGLEGARRRARPCGGWCGRAVGCVGLGGVAGGFLLRGYVGSVELEPRERGGLAEKLRRRKDWVS